MISGMPKAFHILSFPRLIESNALRKPTNAVTTGRFWFLTPSNTFLRARIFDKVALSGRKPFWFFLRIGLTNDT